MKHCVLVKFNEKAGKERQEEFFPEIRTLFGRLSEIPGVHGVELLRNVVERPNRYDLLIRIDMDEEALSAYDESDVHKEWKSVYGPYFAKKAVFDYEDASEDRKA